MARTVLLVDDHAGFRAQARILLTSVGFDVVGEAEDAGQALTAARELQPHVVLLDIQLPDGSGFDVARALLDAEDAPVVILISSREASDYGARIHRSGARGFITKTELSAGAIAALIEEDR
jgi:DNA-binding NarL/FixJ family response regulator